MDARHGRAAPVLPAQAGRAPEHGAGWHGPGAPREVLDGVLDPSQRIGERGKRVGPALVLAGAEKLGGNGRSWARTHTPLAMRTKACFRRHSEPILRRLLYFTAGARFEQTQ